MSEMNKSNAGGAVAGLTYQIWYFLYKLLKIEIGEIVSFEKLDDVGAEKDGKTIYYQLKHTLKSSKTELKHMCDRETGLWKTLNLWIGILKGKGDEEAQKDWIAKSEFILLSNMSTDDNTFFQRLHDYKSEGKWKEMKTYLAAQAAKSERTESKEGEEKERKNIRTYTKNVNEYPLIKDFLRKVRPELRTDEDITKDIDTTLQYTLHIPHNNVSVLRFTLGGVLLNKLNNAKEVAYDAQSFDNDFGSLFQKMRTRKFVPVPKSYVVPEEPQKQTFIKQLQRIGDPRAKEMDDVKELTEQRLQFENEYNHALLAGGRDDRISFERDVRNRWKNHFLEHNDGLTFMSDDEEINAAAKKVLKGVRGELLRFDEDNLNSEESNGCFYYFSDGDEPKLGWRADWQLLYNGKEWTIE